MSRATPGYCWVFSRAFILGCAILYSFLDQFGILSLAACFLILQPCNAYGWSRPYIAHHYTAHPEANPLSKADSQNYSVKIISCSQLKGSHKLQALMKFLISHFHSEDFTQSTSYATSNLIAEAPKSARTSCRVRFCNSMASSVAPKAHRALHRICSAKKA